MAEEGLLSGGHHSGLAVVLKGESSKEGSQRSRLVSFCDDFGDQSVERTLEHIFGLSYKTVRPLTQKIDLRFISSILENEDYQFQKDTKNAATSNRDGLLIVPDHSGPPIVGIDESSISGDIKIIKPPLILESHALFSSLRANSCVWKGKWMYEVTLETAGIQQIGWASLSCPFTELKGVGDSNDSYAYDGKRVTKWNKNAEPYGQPWVVGDVIGCCIDLDYDEIIFYRNGVSLGAAFSGIRKIAPGLGYFPALSLSHGESCELNFGDYPFRYPIKDYLPIVCPPSAAPFANNLLSCFSRLIEMQRDDRAEVLSVEKLRMLKRFVSFQEIFHPVSQGIGRAFFSVMNLESSLAEYISWGPLLSFFIQVFRPHPPHDFKSIDRVLDCLLEFQESRPLFLHIINALSSGCKVSPFVLSECPHSGSYTHLALAGHILRREELMILWWRSSNFEFSLEGFLSRKSPNKQDLLGLIPFVCWPGSNEDLSNENNMLLTTTALSEAVKKVEQKQRELCSLIMQFIPPASPQLPGSVFRTFLQNVLLKNRGADRNLPPPGVSKNSVLISLFSVILHFLSEGFAISNVSKLLMGSGSEIGFLHRGGQQAFPMSLFLKNDPHRVDISRIGGSFDHLTNSHPVHDDQEDEVIRWEEGCMDDEEVKVAHTGSQKPCCCSSYDTEYTKSFKDPIRHVAKGSRPNCSSVPKSSVHVNEECSTGSLSDEITDKPSTSDQTASDYSFQSVQQTRTVLRQINLKSATLKEEELLDAMLLLYHLGVSPNLKQASSYGYRQSQSIALLEETDRQIRERTSGEQVTHLKDARSTYREEVMDCIRYCAWYRVSLFSRWKQRGMYATCMYVAQLLLILSKEDAMFAYVPEYYLETLVNCFHVLRKSDPLFVPTSIFIRQGLTSFVTFVVTHFNDPRIESAELKDLLLQSISVLVEYKEHLAVFESNEAATVRLPKALLEAFDDRSWILVTNVLLRLCKGYGFCSLKHGGSSSISIVFQILLREACTSDIELFSSFLNRLFNKLSWAMTEFSVSIREMQEYYKALEFQQRKCSYIYDISCNLARVLEFCTGEIPQAFLSGADTNLRRLTEIIVFILNHLDSAGDPEFFDLSIKRRPGQAFEKIHRGMILSPLAGIMTNLLAASEEGEDKQHIDIVETFASMDCPASVLNGFQYILDYDWGSSFTGDEYLGKIRQLENFSSMLVCRTASQELESTGDYGESGSADTICYICYACEAGAQFVPCSHRSCFGCISRHLLNCQRCFFCNATVIDVMPADGKPA
ncbi:hypothetical protein Leryth_002032 [Lithospermum erythrorhizon]|nr:hypothetical protein Leryth_002032 [Lithospermum erythrorhizon]